MVYIPLCVIQKPRIIVDFCSEVNRFLRNIIESRKIFISQSEIFMEISESTLTV